MATDSPSISAIVIVRNEEATIRRSLRSALSQTVPVDEVIVVDGGSIDRTLQHVAEVAAEHKHVRVTTSDSTSRSAARNAGAAIASGEMLLFLNADVVVGSSYLAALLASMNERQLDAAAGLRWNVRRSALSGLMNIHQTLNYGANPQVLDSPDFLWSDALLVRAEHFWRVGGYDPNIAISEDVDLGSRLRATGSNIGYVRRATIWHEGRHYGSYRDWVGKLDWHGRSAAARARAHDWRMDRERSRLQKHVLLPLSAILIFMLMLVTLGSVSGALAWGLGLAGFIGAGLRYLRSAADVQRRCRSADLPGMLPPQDVLLYPLFRFSRRALLSVFTWRTLLALTDDRRESTGDRAL